MISVVLCCGHELRGLVHVPARHSAYGVPFGGAESHFLFSCCGHGLGWGGTAWGYHLSWSGAFPGLVFLGSWPAVLCAVQVLGGLTDTGRGPCVTPLRAACCPGGKSQGSALSQDVLYVTHSERSPSLGWLV